MEVNKPLDYGVGVSEVFPGSVGTKKFTNGVILWMEAHRNLPLEPYGERSGVEFYVKTLQVNPFSRESVVTNKFRESNGSMLFMNRVFELECVFGEYIVAEKARAAMGVVSRNPSRRDVEVRTVLNIRFYLVMTESYNNIMGTLTTTGGDVLLKVTGGMIGSSGSKKNSSYAANQVGYELGKRANRMNIRQVCYVTKEHLSKKVLSFIKGFRDSGCRVKYIELRLVGRHESFRLRKARRV